MPMTIEADAADSGWTIGTGPSRIRESIFVNSTAESSDDTRGFRLSIARVHPGNLLVTVHVLIFLPPLLCLSLSLYACDGRVRELREFALFVLRAGIF